MRVHTPRPPQAAASAVSSSLLARSVEISFDCAEACTSCAHACMDAPSKDELQDCIRLNLECADLCFAAGSLASRPAQLTTEHLLDALERAADACRLCAEECERRADSLGSCKSSVEACRRCQEALTLAIQDVGGATGLIQTN